MVLIVKLKDERQRQAKMSSPTEGPYAITQVFNNGTVRIQCRAYQEKIHIRRLKPYKITNTNDDNTSDQEDD